MKKCRQKIESLNQNENSPYYRAYFIMGILTVKSITIRVALISLFFNLGCSNDTSKRGFNKGMAADSLHNKRRVGGETIQSSYSYNDHNKLALINLPW